MFSESVDRLDKDEHVKEQVQAILNSVTGGNVIHDELEYVVFREDGSFQAMMGPEARQLLREQPGTKVFLFACKNKLIPVEGLGEGEDADPDRPLKDCCPDLD